MNFLCSHNWSFPLRHARFEEHRAVDVETCVRCGQKRLAKTQFAGSTLATAKLHASVNFNEGNATA
jgi:hypothetical protein